MIKCYARSAGQRRLAAAGILVLASGLGGARCVQAQGASYDVVIVNGRVMDPESGIDGVRNVGISGGKIHAISSGSLKGKQTIDAKGLVVAPGFIDLHEHGQEPRNYQFQAHDGVTTSLELEGGTDDVDKWYANREGNSLINYGVSIGHLQVRVRAMMNISVGSLVDTRHGPEVDAANHRPATPEQIARMQELIETGLKRGALAEGMGINYTPGATHSEIVEMFRVAAKYNAPVHV